jgi:hypothetical protein
MEPSVCLNHKVYGPSRYDPDNLSVVRLNFYALATIAPSMATGPDRVLDVRTPLDGDGARTTPAV